MDLLLLIIVFFLTQSFFWIPARFKGKSRISTVIRRTLYMLPYLYFLKFLDFERSKFDSSMIIFLLFSVSILILIEGNSFKFKSSATFAQIQGPLTITDFSIRTYNLILCIFAEESFFRLGILSLYPSSSGVVLQSLAFVGSHYFTPWGRSLRTTDLVRQLLFSIFSGIYFLKTDDFILCVIAHFLLNLPEVIHLVRRSRTQSFTENVIYE